MKNFILIYSRHYTLYDMAHDTKEDALEFSKRHEDLGTIYPVLIIDLQTKEVVWQNEMLSSEAIKSQAKRVLSQHKQTT